MISKKSKLLKVNTKIIIGIFLFTCTAFAGVQEERQKYGQARLKQLRTQAQENSGFQYIDTFKDGPESYLPKIHLYIKVIKLCKQKEPCVAPSIWRHLENGKIVQYERHNCFCDRHEQISISKIQQKAKELEYWKKQKRLAEEKEQWKEKYYKRKRQAALRRDDYIDYGYYGRGYYRQHYRYHSYRYGHYGH